MRAFAVLLVALWLPLHRERPAELEALLAELERSPEDPALLAEVAQAYVTAEDPDNAVWYAGLALERADPKRDRKVVGALTELLDEVGPEGLTDDAPFEAYTESLFRVAQSCQRKKLWANAVDLLSRMEGTRFEGRAEGKLEKLFKDDKTVQALLESGIDIPARPVTKKKPEWIAREDEKHADFEDAYEIKGPFYTVITNMGYEMAHSIALAMEQMNGFYRRVFGYKQRGGSMRRCVLKVYARRAEFDGYEGMADKQSVKGFFRPSENSVTTYDPRTERSGGRPLASLWSTLFHEASHQFIRAATSGNDLPGWLNEGTASYFEGAELLSSGVVATNRIPTSRLRNLKILIGRGSPTVRDVVSYFRPGSYDGSYYPFGWGLMYYFQNYEDEESERVYLPIYADYLESYKSGGKHDPFERFLEYFVERAAVPGVDSYEAFVAHWQAWIEELYELNFGGPEKAELLVERGRRQRANGKLDYAIESYRWALEKRDDPRARFELAETLAEADNDDGAVYAYREVVAAARARGGDEPLAGFTETPTELIGLCHERISAIDRTVGEALLAADDEFATAARSEAEALRAAGFPRAALRRLETAETVLAGDAGLAGLAAEIRSADGLDLRRWRRPKVEDGLELWEGGDGWRAEEEALVVQAAAGKGILSLVYRGDMPDRYRLEAWLELGPAGEFPVYGLVFGANLQTGMRMFAALPKADLLGMVALEDGPEIVERFGPIPEVDRLAVQMAVEVERGHVRFFLDGEQVGEVELSPRAAAGRIGVFAQESRVTFREVRVLY